MASPRYISPIYLPHWPTVSACESPTIQLLNYVTHFVQPLVEILPSYIRDSRHFLQLLESLPPLPENAILVTDDVTLLYTSIRHEEGIEYVLHYMKLNANTLPPGAPSPHTIGVLLETIRKKNYVSFMNRHFLQLVSTAMGTKASPLYSNLFMGRHDEIIRKAFIWAIPCRWHLPDLPTITYKIFETNSSLHVTLHTMVKV